MPSRPYPLWLLTLALVVGVPVLNVYYWMQVGKAGIYPPENDAVVGMSMTVGTILWIAMFAPAIIGITESCLKRYNPASKILTWRRDRLMRSLLATLAFGGAAVGLGLILASDLHRLSGSAPWYEFIPVCVQPPAIAWLLAMRAALIDQS